jgi:hypothetical protein
MATREIVPLRDTDRALLRKSRPWFVFGAQRRRHDAELSQETCIRYTATVRRAWDLTGCTPSCCGSSYLLDVGEGQYFLIETWEFLAHDNEYFPGTDIEVRCSALSGEVISASASGPRVRLEEPSISTFGPTPPNEGCALVSVNDLSDEVKQAIGAAEQRRAADPI